jgi:hypothetical protein
MRIKIGNYLVGVNQHGYLLLRAGLLFSRIFFSFPIIVLPISRKENYNPGLPPAKSPALPSGSTEETPD